jgi:5-(carboxyamino)imidazole ribonucleotide synthase
VEFFVLKDAQGGVSDASELRVNEIAPRPHNSGHWSIDGSSVSQFELQVRTLCGLPLAQPVQRCPSVMLNLLGDLWFDEAGKSREPDWASVLAMPGVSLHLYGKNGARKARKMGHITITADSPEAVTDVTKEVANLLSLPYKPSLP